MKRIILHAGLHRTGTTSVQIAASESRDELVKRGVLFPEGCNLYPDQHSSVAFDLKNGREEKVVERLTEIERKADELGCEKIFLSGEEFCDVNAELLSKFNTLCFAPVTVFLTFRNYAEWFSSQVRYQSNFVPGFLFFDAMNQVVKLNYSEIINNFSSAFGDDAVQALDFKALKHNLVTNAFKAMLDVDGLATNDYPTINASLSFGASSITSMLATDFSPLERLKVIKRLGERTQHLDTSALKTLDHNLKASIVPPAGCFDHPKLAGFKEELMRTPSIALSNGQHSEEGVEYIRVLLSVIDELQNERVLEAAND
ncbi:MAG: hypothetical protein AAF542_14090 [Pseudomonadota bacterium]